MALYFNLLTTIKKIQILFNPKIARRKEEMYVTMLLSHCIQFPNSLSDLPEGPNSGYLVIKDEQAETYCCFGLCNNHDLMNLPFPQNKDLIIRNSTGVVKTKAYLTMM